MGKGNPLVIVQENEIWLYYQIVFPKYESIGEN